MPQVTMTITAHAENRYYAQKIKQELEAQARESQLCRVFTNKSRKKITGWTSEIKTQLGAQENAV